MRNSILLLRAVSRCVRFPAPDIIVREIVDDLEAALEQFREITEDLEEKNTTMRQLCIDVQY